MHGSKWDDLFTLTVGNAGGDLNGTDQRAIQAAVDTVARMGGGTVKLLAAATPSSGATSGCSSAGA